LTKIAKQARPGRDFQNALSLLLLRVDTTRSCQRMAEERIQALRLELKTWEKQFSAQNGGKRPSREDIKNNVEIGIQARDLESTSPY
jgi:hypothetical protein